MWCSSASPTYEACQECSSNPNKWHPCLHGQYAIVLYWIFGCRQHFKTFEANRVAEIQEIVPPEKWKHVKGEENPADAGSRGVLPENIINHKLWWSGPCWLTANPSSWQSISLEALQNASIREEDLILRERKEVTVQTNTTSTQPKPVIDINWYSTFLRLVKVTAFVRRVITQ